MNTSGTNQQATTYSSQILSVNSHDYLPVTIIPVIASFNDDGQIKPLYIGIEGNRYKVDSYWIRRSFTNQIEFSCKILIDDRLCPIILTYYMNECIWTIPNLNP